ncbi:MAG: type II CRISPR RNA-guided endonuclease Cas9 [Lachnospiraceae bacterium]
MKNFGEYYLGLDIGTNSVGWAVTDQTYQLQKLNGKAMWGIRLFKEAETAEARRIQRSARRRLQRKVSRIQMLQELFAEEICKVDPGFYQRMQDSKYYQEDKREDQSNTLFCDKAYQDKNYHQEYPTIYHLRAALLSSENKFDVRLVYLAIHNILKHRGHFLFEGQNMKSVISFANVYFDLKEYVYDAYEIELECADVEEVKHILISKKIGKTEKKKRLKSLFYTDTKDKQKMAIIGLLAGTTEKLCDLFQEEGLAETEKPKICFTDAGYEESRQGLDEILHEKCYLIDKLKAVYDWALLSDILQGEQYISVSKVKTYEKHKYDLEILKKMVHTHCPEQYKEIFQKANGEKYNYCHYIGMNIKNGKKQTIEKHCSQEELCKYLLGIFQGIQSEEEEFLYLIEELQNNTLLPKQITKDNGVIPYQVHEMELFKILDNASEYLTFLNEKDESGYSVKEKIVKMFEFRIPYYVGPLNDAHKELGGNCWIVKKSNEKITPWNFEEVVDLEASAEAFILRMTNKCTYLLKEDVLPAHSLLYSEFTVLNELNNVRIGQEKLSVSLKQQIYRDLFMKYKRVTGKKLNDYLVKEGIKEKSEELSGFDQNFKSSLSSYLDFKSVIGERIDLFEYQQMAEQIILWIVLYGEDKKLVRGRVKKTYSKLLSEEEQKKICNLKYAGWGRLSRTFLTELTGAEVETGECQSIIQALRNTQNNLMQLLSQQYTYLAEIEAYNDIQDEVEEITYQMLEGLYLSPSVKHMIWQTLVIVQELKKVIGHQPKKIFIEMARGEEKDKKRKESRKVQLMELYKQCKKEERDWIGEIDKREEGDYRSDRLYLYYTQKGLCMYSGEPINLAQLFDKNVYDVDHIYPQSKTKDDSIENRVLVKREINAKKTDVYPLTGEIQKLMQNHWKLLHEQKFIGDKKYDRLTRKTEFSDQEKADFIARQLVETRQTTKAVADILKRVFRNSEIVYAKAGNVSEFRRDYKLLKVREVNDYHHAQDAFLNIVVGNVYHTRFTSNPINFIKKTQGKSYSLNKMFQYQVERNGYLAWQPGEDGTIRQIKQIMNKNNILSTRASYEGKGGLFNQTLYGKEKCQTGHGYIPLKGEKDSASNMQKYGGYGSVTGAYFFAVEHTIKKKRIRTIEFVPIYLKEQIQEERDLLAYCTKKLELSEPVIIVKKIKMQSLINVDGYFLHLTGRSGNQLIVNNAVQMCLDFQHQRYVKKIEKFLARRVESKGKLQVNEFDEITEVENCELYEILKNKHCNTIYAKRPNPQGKTIEAGRERFTECTIEEQCYVLGQILQLTQGGNLGADLKLIGGAQKSGVMLLSKEISKYNMFTIVNQSPTGLFRQEIDLQKE